MKLRYYIIPCHKKISSESGDFKQGDGVMPEPDYSAGIEYKNGFLDAIYHSEGCVYYEADQPRYEYAIRDHLGNTRLMFSDLNGNGVIDVSDDPESTEILQENHYYPFGMEMEGPWEDVSGTIENDYLYNGKELNEDFGLNWYAYGARMYDPAVGRFTGVDPISDQFPHVSTYNYAENEPVAHIDLHGLQKYKPKMESIEKPSDLVSGKMLNNLKEGVKTVAIEFVSEAKGVVDKLTPGQEGEVETKGGTMFSLSYGKGNENRNSENAEVGPNLDDLVGLVQGGGAGVLNGNAKVINPEIAEKVTQVLDLLDDFAGLMGMVGDGPIDVPQEDSIVVIYRFLPNQPGDHSRSKVDTLIIPKTKQDDDE